MPNKAPGPKVLRLQLGRELRALREGRDLTREELATRFSWHASKVSRIEQGQATLTVDEIDRYLRELTPETEVADRIRQLSQEARKRGSYGKVQDWARGFIGMETDADRLRMYDAELVHGLFQTEAYARAVLSTSVVVGPAEVDRAARNRVARQQLLTRQNPPEVHAVFGEAALYRQIGGTTVLNGQLDHLRTVAALPNVTLQILSFAAGEHAALGTGFSLLDIYDVSATYVYLEDLTSSDFWDKASHTDAYELAFSRLCTAALSERETLSAIETAQARLQ